MNRNTLLLALCLASIVAAPGCETTGATVADAGNPNDDASEPIEDADLPDTNADTGPVLQTQLTYTPTGCGYAVSTPTVTETGMGMDVFGDTPEPDHIHTSWAGPTDTTFAINWHTGLGTLASSVLFGTDMAAVAAADDAGSGVTRQEGHFMRFRASSSPGGFEIVHEAHVCGLSADTEYFYKVGGPGHWSQVYSFSTAPVVGSTAPYTFGVTGDSRGYEDNAWAITQHHFSDRAVDFQLFSGDAVVAGPNQGEWNQFFTQVDGAFDTQDFLATRPMMMANGNHDLLSVNYLVQFALPQDVSDGEIGQGEDWYSFDYANAHFIVLNDTVTRSSVIGGQEAAWLSADLAAVDRAQTPWVFVTHHQPMYTCTAGRPPDTNLRAAWQSVFDQYHVDMVFNGHNHEYERSAPIFGFDSGGGHVASEGANAVPVIAAGGIPSGTIYMVAAGAGAPLYSVNTDCPETRHALSVRAYLILEIQDRSLQLTAYDALTNSVIDQMTYTK
ncbi:MAG: metallophosphoesterase family protein [Sandaracinus sp.]